jgi:phage baseplate assembly protein W
MPLLNRADRYTVQAVNDSKVVYSDFYNNFNSFSASGVLASRTNEDAVKNSIRNLIFTNKYERFYEPKKGVGITRFLFEPMSEDTASRMSDAIKNAIKRYEPRAELIDDLPPYTYKAINIIPYEDQNLYVVTVTFRVINKAEPVSVTFTLERVR